MTAATNSIFRAGLFTDRTIVVSGGGTGIGRSIARELAALGATVVLCARKIDQLEAVRDEIIAAGGQADAAVCNIREPDSVTAFFAGTVERHGPIHGLVNNAGGQFIANADAISPRGWHAVVETNLTGTFYMAQAAFNSSMREHGGSIVNILLDYTRGFPGMSHSSAARAGVANLTQTLAVEWAQYGVHINSVAPGMIKSSGLLHYPPEVQAGMEGVAKDIPAQRMGSESEVAAPVVFLLSPAAAFISGATLRVDGAGSLYKLQGYVVPEHAPWPAFDAFADGDGGDQTTQQ